MLTLQKSSWIEAAEPDVVEIHRSRSPVGFSPDPSTPMTLQAFALVLKGEEGFSVCLALHGREIRRALVYAVDPSPKGHASFAEPLRKGLAALKGLGFDLEPLNLKYSPAMREVVLRDIPVILSPTNHRKVQKEKADLLQQLQRQADDLPGPEEELFDDPQLPATEQAKREQARQARRDAATSALSKLAVEKRVEEQAQALARLLGELFAGKKRALPSPPAEAAKAKAAPARSTAPAVPRCWP